MFDPTASPIAPTLSLAVTAEPLVLVSWWKALVLLLPFVPWAWLVSSVFDKHAARFYLGQEKWAAIHTVAGIAALAVGFLLPIPAWWGFIVAFLGVVMILGADIGAFVVITNKDEGVPAAHRLKLDFSKFAEARKAKEAQKQQASVTLEIKRPGGDKVTPPQKDTPEYEVRAAAEEVFAKATTARASQVDILPTGKEGVYGLRLLVDGVYQAAEQLPAGRAIKIIDFWKGCADLDVEDRRRKLTADCTVSHLDRPVKVRVTSSGIRGGMRLTLKMNPEASVKRAFDDLGLLAAQRETFGSLEPGGLVLLAAKPLQGATTTLYAMTTTHDAYTENVQTVELEPEAMIEGVRQIKYEPGDQGVEYSTTLRSILRRDPDVVAVAELPDADTAREVAQAEVDRTRIYLSVRADGALAAAQFFVKAVGDAEKASKPLRAIVAQKLARKLCENCRVGYQPPAELLKKLGLPADKVKQLYKKGGQVLIRNKPETCPVCGGTGFDGQFGLFEVYPVGPEEQAAIAKQEWNALRALWKKRGLPNIGQVALRRAAEGVTSIDEVSRVTSSSSSSKKPSSSKPAGDGQPVAAS